MVLAILASAGSAHAGSFVEAVGGAGLPLGDDEWKRDVTLSAKVGARVGVMIDDGLGIMISADWTHEVCQNGQLGGLGIPEGDVSIQTLRALASAVVRQRVAPSITISGRAGVGVDYVLGRVDGIQDFGSTTLSGNDLGLAIELGVGIWFDFGDHTGQWGVELALPIGRHSDQPFYQASNLTIDYTSVDVDLLLGVRF